MSSYPSRVKEILRKRGEKALPLSADKDSWVRLKKRKYWKTKEIFEKKNFEIF